MKKKKEKQKKKTRLGTIRKSFSFPLTVAIANWPAKCCLYFNFWGTKKLFQIKDFLRNLFVTCHKINPPTFFLYGPTLTCYADECLLWGKEKQINATHHLKRTKEGQPRCRWSVTDFNQRLQSIVKNIFWNKLSWKGSWWICDINESLTAGLQL